MLTVWNNFWVAVNCCSMTSHSYEVGTTLNVQLVSHLHHTCCQGVCVCVRELLLTLILTVDCADDKNTEFQSRWRSSVCQVCGTFQLNTSCESYNVIHVAACVKRHKLVPCCINLILTMTTLTCLISIPSLPFSCTCHSSLVGSIHSLNTLLRMSLCPS